MDGKRNVFKRKNKEVRWPPEKRDLWDNHDLEGGEPLQTFSQGRIHRSGLVEQRCGRNGEKKLAGTFHKHLGCRSPSVNGLFSSASPGALVETGTIAGIVSGLAMALIGAVSSYISYQQKKFCFSIQQGLNAEYVKGENMEAVVTEEPQGEWVCCVLKGPVCHNALCPSFVVTAREGAWFLKGCRTVACV
uniref:CD99 antigen-like protein 2 n=1 Tax=Naja naja TaxID=35670 RepID=A0A8C7E6L4_NAJNA